MALALVFLVVALGCGSSESESSSEPDLPLASDFTLPLLNGGEATLSAYRGKPVLIDFWATWCAPCVGQIPLFNDFHAKYGDELPLLAVATDTEGAEAVAPFAEEHGIAYPVLMGSEALARDWGLLGFPTLFVIDAEGRIQEAHVGPLSEDWLLELAEELQAGS